MTTAGGEFEALKIALRQTKAGTAITRLYGGRTIGVSSGIFEGLKYAYRQTKDGIVISFTVHPNDLSNEFTALPIGARVTVLWAEIEDEQASCPAPTGPVTTAPQRGEETAATHKPRRGFADMAPAAQAALRCKDVKFQKWLVDSDEDIPNEETAAEGVRYHCRVKTRGDLNTDRVAAMRWRKLNDYYESWLTEQQHGALVR